MKKTGIPRFHTDDDLNLSRSNTLHRFDDLN